MLSLEKKKKKEKKKKTMRKYFGWKKTPRGRSSYLPYLLR